MKKGVFPMNHTRIGFMFLIFLFGATILTPVFFVDTASACGGGCAARDYDRCGAGGCGSCERCATVSHFLCDLNQCGWVPDFDSCLQCYGCSACGPR
jgi:hypothetical protein